MKGVTINDDTLKEFLACPLKLRYYKDESAPSIADVFSFVGGKMASFYERAKKMPEYGIMVRWFSAAWKSIFRDYPAILKDKKKHNTSILYLPSFYEWYKERRVIPIANNITLSYKHGGVSYATMIPQLVWSKEKKRPLPIFYKVVRAGMSLIELNRDMSLRMGISLCNDLINPTKYAYVILVGYGSRVVGHTLGPLNAEFFKKTYEMMDGVMDSIGRKTYYPNLSLCNRCEYNRICEP